MNFKLSELLSIYKPEQLNEFLRKYANTDLENDDIMYEDINDNWTCVGDTKYNFSAINMLKDSGKGLIERITNGIDAVLEKEKEKYKLNNAKTADDIIKVAFPHYYENKEKVKKGEANRQNACETADMVVVAINDSTKSIPSRFSISSIISLTLLLFKSLLIIIISGLTILNLSFNSSFVLTLSSVLGNEESSL